MQSWITNIQWVPRGALAQQPIDYEMEPEILEDLKTKMNNTTISAPTKDLGDELAGSSDDDSDAEMGEEKDEDVMAALDMDNYTDDDSDAAEEGVLDRFLTQASGYAGDQYLVDDEEEDDDEDAEDNQIDPQDSVLLVAQTVPGQDDCFIEVYCYNNETNALYVHHDIQLPADPICMQFMNCNPRVDGEGNLQQGAFVAVGTFNPGIEIWNLDVMNPIEPVATLGGYDPVSVREQQALAKKGQKKKVMTPKLLENSHSDAIMALAWHPNYPARLLSSSSDCTIKLWDITSKQCVHTYNHHKSEVCAIEWNPKLPEVYLAASQDGCISIVDIEKNQPLYSFALKAPAPVAPKKTPTTKKKLAPPKPPQLLETVRWNNVNPNIFYAARTDGSLECFDIRKTPQENPIWSLQASQDGKPITSFATNKIIDTLFVTVGEDKIVKVWDIPPTPPTKKGDAVVYAPNPEQCTQRPQLLTQRMVDVGRLFSVQFDINDPFVLSCGGDAGCVAVWDLMENLTVNNKYKVYAEQVLALGDQTLTEEHIQDQINGIQSKGIGPGRQYKEAEKEDYDSDDEQDEEGVGYSFDQEEEDEEDDDRMELDQ